MSASLFSEATAEDRARLAVRMAVRAFGDGSRAGQWLAEPNSLFDGESPLLVAKASVAGCARVCEILTSMV
jgi:uncharacterized protein (DUF2384 family)